VLGVCLGQQCIGEAFGGRTVRARRPLHGRTAPVYHDGSGVLAGLPSPFAATRYHSLVVDEATLPRELVVTARSAEGEIMALRHTGFPVHGVQFHPESAASEWGYHVLANFLGVERVGLPAGADMGTPAAAAA
jgi:anthranilate synthase/aminodeoxychorismate synthase-like glutamine amidotransferase